MFLKFSISKKYSLVTEKKITIAKRKMMSGAVCGIEKPLACSVSPVAVSEVFLIILLLLT
jgi:hypothetical protein